jgi:hypothetical protein
LDHVHLAFHQIGRMPREPVNGQAVTTHIHREVLAVDEAEPPQLVEERDMMRGITWADNQRSHAINPSEFLPARRERPSNRRAAEQRDERAPPDASCHLILPAGVRPQR